MGRILKNLKKFMRRFRAGNVQAHLDMSAMKSILIDEYIEKHVHTGTKYQDPRRLARFEYQVYSQNGEDGIIEEIFRRIGVTNKFFVELGVQNGLECNTTNLLVNGWSGYWVEGSRDCVEQLSRTFSELISKGVLRIRNAFIVAENISSLLKSASIEKEFDLLSIDIDGNDYWVWKALADYAPRAVVIEYNAMFRSNVKWVMKYNPDHVWTGTSYFNASLKSLELLGEQKGYKLVACNFTGANAFFVREDLICDKFCSPFTAENHYEPIRYHLQKKDGFRRDFGEFESI